MAWNGWIVGWLAGTLVLGGSILGMVAVNAAAIVRSTFPYKSAASKAELGILITLAILSWPPLLFFSLVLFLVLGGYTIPS